MNIRTIPWTVNPPAGSLPLGRFGGTCSPWTHASVGSGSSWRVGRKGRNTVMWMVLAATFLLVPVVAAHAYIDPGTGSMIVQVVIAALVGGAAFIGAFWRKWFRRRRDHDDDQAETGKE